MRWFAGGLLWACAAFYVLAGLLGAILAMLVNIAMLAGLGLVGHMLFNQIGKTIKDSDQKAEDDHKS